MKVTVWTKIWVGSQGADFRKPKCIAIFDDYKFPLPVKGTQVQVRDGFGYEVVDCVLLDMVNGTVEVHLQTSDLEEGYGPSLLFKMQIGDTNVSLPTGEKK